MDKEKLREKQKIEAIERLKILEQTYMVHPNVLKEFKADGTVYYSENLGGVYCGILYWLDNKENFVEEVKKVEEENNIFVYHCMLQHSTFGDILSMLFISSDIENWEEERQDLKDGNIVVYGCDLQCSCFSEFGSTQIKGVNGGIMPLY